MAVEWFNMRSFLASGEPFISSPIATPHTADAFIIATPHSADAFIITDPFYRFAANRTVPLLEGYTLTGRVKLVVVSNTLAWPGVYGQSFFWLETYGPAPGVWPPPGEYIANDMAFVGYVGYGYPETAPGSIVFKAFFEADYTPPPPPLFWSDFVGSQETETP